MKFWQKNIDKFYELNHLFCQYFAHQFFPIKVLHYTLVNFYYTGKDQVSTFLESNGGPGVQHIAFHTDDIISTASKLRKQGLSMIDPPVEYYSLPVSICCIISNIWWDPSKMYTIEDVLCKEVSLTGGFKCLSNMVGVNTVIL